MTKIDASLLQLGDYVSAAGRPAAVVAVWPGGAAARALDDGEVVLCEPLGIPLGDEALAACGYLPSQWLEENERYGGRELYGFPVRLFEGPWCELAEYDAAGGPAFAFAFPSADPYERARFGAARTVDALQRLYRAACSLELPVDERMLSRLAFFFPRGE